MKGCPTLVITALIIAAACGPQRAPADAIITTAGGKLSTSTQISFDDGRCDCSHEGQVGEFRPPEVGGFEQPVLALDCPACSFQFDLDFAQPHTASVGPAHVDGRFAGDVHRVTFHAAGSGGSNVSLGNHVASTQCRTLGIIGFRVSGQATPISISALIGGSGDFDGEVSLVRLTDLVELGGITRDATGTHGSLPGGPLDPGDYQLECDGRSSTEPGDPGNFSWVLDVSVDVGGGAPAEFHWTNPAGGDFGLAANWNPQQFPSRSDTAIFDLTGNGSPIPILGRDNAIGRMIVQHMNVDLNGPVRVLGGLPGIASFAVGDGGILGLNDGVQFLSSDAAIGTESGSESSVFVSGAGTKWSNVSDQLLIGDVAPGKVVIDHDGLLDVPSKINVGNTAAGTLRVESGGRVNTPNCTLNNGSIQVRGSGTTVGSLLKIDSDLDIGGQSGTGHVVVENGGGITAHKVLVGDRAATGGETVTISGVDNTGLPSTLSATGIGNDAELHVAGNAATQVEVKDGGSLSVVGEARVGENSAVGKVLVHGVHSSWDTFGKAFIGGQRTASELIVEDGGHVTCSDQMVLGSNSGELGKATISGGESLVKANTLAVGSDGQGELVLTDGAQVQSVTGIVGQSHQVASGLPPTPGGGAGGGLVTIQGDPVSPSLWHVTGNCFVATDERALITLQGTTIGPITVGGATLQVDGALTVGPQGAISGFGTLTAGRVFNHGLISPGLSPGVIAIEGDYEQAEDGVLKIEVAGLEDGQFDVLKVTGNAKLAGRVDLQFINGFVPKPGDNVDFAQISGQITGKLSGDTLVPAGTDSATSQPAAQATVKWEVTPEGTCQMTVTDVTAADQSALQVPAISGCGAGLCGAGVVPMLPTTLVGLFAMRSRLRRRTPPS